MASIDPHVRREIDAVIYAEIRKRDRRNARFWFAALVVGAFAFTAAVLLEIQPPLKALFALIGFVGIFGFLAFLSTRKSLRGCIDDVFDRS
jgi:Flp pilus assembly protein TadB